jgi:hypothetical protein
MDDIQLSSLAHMADGVLTSSFEQSGASYFLARKLCQKTRGHVLALVLDRKTIKGDIMLV